MNGLLREQRKLRGFSLLDVCVQLEVHPTTLLRWERRERLPGPHNVKALAAVLELNVSAVSEFFHESRSMRPQHDLGLRGHGLRCLRDAAGMSARSVAGQIGVPAAHVYNWESGRARIPLHSLPALAQALGLKTEVVRAFLRAAPTTTMRHPARSPLSQLRRRTGLSQEQVAISLGLSRRSLGNWERGSAVPLHAVRRLAQIYGVPVSVVAKAAGVKAPHLLRPDQWAEGDLPRVLRILRQWSGLTQARLAQLCDVSTTSIRGWEQGRTKPRPRSRCRLEALYGLPPNALLRAYPTAGGAG